MAKLTVDLPTLQGLNLDFDRYFLLWYCYTGTFEARQIGPEVYKVFNLEDFEHLYPDLIRRDPLAVLRSLGHTGHIDLTAGFAFRVTNKQPFTKEQLKGGNDKAPREKPISETLPEAAVKKAKEKPKGPVKTKLLEGCRELDHFNSPEFIDAWRDYEAVMTKKKKYRTENTTKLGALDLLKLSNGDEATATLIVQQSTNGGWPGFFPLKDKSQQSHPQQSQGQKKARNASDLYA